MASTATATLVVAVCSICAARLAHDHVDTVCSPCRRSAIERAARRAAMIVRDVAGSKAAFAAHGLLGVARHLGCTPDEALETVLGLGLVPVVTPRRRVLLSRLLTMNGRSHVAAAAELHISRWTVATYRHDLGLDKVASGTHSRS